MTAQELLAALAAVPGAQPVPVGGDDVLESRLVGGVEVARTGHAEQPALRRVWRQRYGGGPTPLLLIADAPGDESVVHALGPLGHEGPIRLVAAEDLRRALERLPTLGKLHAVRELAEELDRLDRTGVSGLQVKGLGTQHLFAERLRMQPRWKQLEELANDLPREWRPLFERLGYDVEQLPQRNYLLRANGTAAALVRPLADAAAFAKLDAEGRPPEGVLIEDCLEQNVPYGVLASGGRLRLFETKPASGSAVARYLELDAAALPDEDRPLLGLLAPDYLAGDGFEALIREARDFGAKLRTRIDTAIRQSVLPALARELGEWAESEGVDLEDDDRRAELQAATLMFVFRALFLLYAESARHLPVDHEAYRAHSFTRIVRDAAEGVSGRATTLWDRIKVLVAALREGEESWLVPPYNGALFAADGFEGAEVLERASMRNEALAPALVALGIDPESGHGYDFSGLEIGHLGHIYEGLLSLRLSVADRPYWYEAKRDRYAAEGETDPEVDAGELLWLTDEGGRKGGGVYYTPEPLVRHLIRRGVVPAFDRHLTEVERIAETDPEAAARRLLEFRVLDPACGSAHFLVAVVDELADATARFLARRPLPPLRTQLDDLRAGAGATYGVGIEDVALLRRLVLKHCLYGVDVSPMGAEIAKISLWLASFVPGLSLAYLDHNVKVGNSLIGVASTDAFMGLAGDVLGRAVDEAAEAARRLLDVKDRTPDEVQESKRIEREAQERAVKARMLLDLWIAEPLGVPNTRDLAWGQADDLDRLENAETVARASAVAREYRAFQWPVDFPEVFADGGFDAVVGNPPWEEVTVEELAFYARHKPGLRGLPAAERERDLATLKEDRPDLAERLARELAHSAALRGYFGGDTGYSGGAGDPDLYKFFCQRYRSLLRDGGALSVVLPRTAFNTKGSAAFRRWLFDQTSVDRIDFCVNTRAWMFETSSRYTVALLVARAGPSAAASFELAGVADSPQSFETQSREDGTVITRDALGPLLEVPLLESTDAAALLAKLRATSAWFPFGGGHWRCFPVAEFHETADKALWAGEERGWALWKGESFDQYDPHGNSARFCPPSPAALTKARKPRPGADSLLARDVSVIDRAAVVARDIGSHRVAFRDVSRGADPRTIRACLTPRQTFLTNKAPYLAFTSDEIRDRLACIAVMNSVIFDWQARRFVEINVNFFILEGLCVPPLSEQAVQEISRLAARLSCVDDRFADVAAAMEVPFGPLEHDEAESLRADIDAILAAEWDLTAEEMEIILADFSPFGVSERYRAAIRARLATGVAATA